MPVFEYTARNLKGELVKDKVDLATRDDVIAHLRKNRMVVVQVRESKGKGGGLGDFFKAGIKTRDVVIFTRQFATMINSGLPLVQALDILSQQTENKVLADVTRTVVYDVEGGHTLADALRKHPKAFTDLYVNMVAAGEAGGILDTILLRLAVFLEKNDSIVRKVKGAMIYPAVIFSVAGIAIATLLIFVIPTFQSMFASVNLQLPLPARTAGNMVIHNAVMESRASIAGGETIAAPLQKSKVFPPMVISMIAVGEQTGGLDEMLTKIADFYDDEVDAAVSALLSLLEPIMIVVLGVIVGGMVVAMYLPIFDMVNAVQ